MTNSISNPASPAGSSRGKPLRVAVIGGGTGGLCLAHGLRGAGVDVAVYERSALRTERLQGYRVHINPQGAKALHECLPPSLWKTFLDTCGRDTGGFGFLTDRMTELMVVENDLVSGTAPVDSHHSVSRITLHQVLSAELEDCLFYGKEFVRYERRSDGRIICHFADGCTAEADVLVGADGGNSRVRKQYLPHAKRVDTGITTIVGKFPLTEESRRRLPARLSEGANNVIPRSGCGLFTAPHEKTGEAVGRFGGNDETAEHDAVLFDNTSSYIMWAYGATASAFPEGLDLSTLDGARLRAVVGTRIRHWDPAFRRLIGETPSATVSLLPIRTSVPVDPWKPSTVTLLGDAIHSMTPFRGIGANTALRDASLLCRELVAAHRGERDVVAAIGDYEAEMTEYGFAAVRDSLRAAEQFVSTSFAGRVLFKNVLRLASAVPSLKRKMFSDQGS
ncbi:NAD(P)/FAD-dependent oxidoreductase [Saccharomonospora sp. NPDC006951]